MLCNVLLINITFFNQNAMFNKIEKVYVNQNEIDTDIFDYKNKLPLNFHEASDIAHWEKTKKPNFLRNFSEIVLFNI